MGALKFGMREQRVLEVKTKLRSLGVDIAEDNVFDIRTHMAVKEFQRARGLTQDGVIGPITDGELGQSGPVALPPQGEIIVNPGQPVDNIDWFGAPWVKFMVDRLGWTEFAQDKKLAVFWPLVGLPNYKTVIGVDFAWCAMIIEPALRSAGYEGTKRADAISYQNFATKADDYWFGSIIHLKHYKGGNHVTMFLYWVDKEKKLAACLGGNQNNGIRITIYDLSGPGVGKETNPGGPRWPKGAPKGRVVTEAEAKKYLKVAGYDVGGSTR